MENIAVVKHHPPAGQLFLYLTKRSKRINDPPLQPS